MAEFVAYKTVQHKVQVYDAVTMAAMRREALKGVGSVADYTLVELYQLMLDGEFVDDPVGGDLIRSVAVTLSHGGDCDDWAVVSAAWAIAHGKDYRFKTCGDRRDSKLHVHTVIEVNPGQWIDVDPQPERMPLGHSSCDGAPVVGTGGIVKTPITSTKHFEELAPVSVRDMFKRLFMERYKASIWPDAQQLQQDPYAASAAQNQLYAMSRSIQRNEWTQPGSNAPKLYEEDVKQLVPELEQWQQQAKAQAQVPDVILKSYTDVKRWLSDAQWKAWAFHIANYDKRRALDPQLKAGTAHLSRNSVLQFLQAVVGLGLGSPLVNPADLLKVTTLEEVNLRMAAAYMQDMPWSVVDARTGITHYPVLAYAKRMSLKPDASQKQARALAAASIAMQANSFGVVLDDWVQYHADNPSASPLDLSHKETAVAGSGKSFFEQVKKFAQHPLKVLREVQRDAGGFIRETAQSILDTEKNIPWLSTFVLKPLGFHLQASLLKQIGLMVENESISAFDETEFIDDVATTLTAAGQVLIIAAPMLPPPYNVLAAALGALSIAAGNVIAHVNSKDRVKQAQAQTQAQLDKQYQVDSKPGPMLKGFKETTPGQAMGLVKVQGVLSWFLVYWRNGEWTPQAYWVEKNRQWVNV